MSLDSVINLLYIAFTILLGINWYEHRTTESS